MSLPALDAAIRKALTTQKVLLTKIKDSIKNTESVEISKRTKGFYDTKIADLKIKWERFDEEDTILRGMIIEANVDCTDDYFSKQKYSKIEQIYMECLGELTNELLELEAHTNTNASANTSANNLPVIQNTAIHGQSVQPQLPRINLPKFNGEYSSWRSFHDLFKSLIHSNPHVQAVQKLQYLKGCLTGDAEKLLKHIPVTEQDYEPAWEKLKNRYENKRVLVNHQIKLLVNQPKLSTENSKGLKLLADTTEECIQQLKSLQVNVASWDALLIYLLVQKLPFGTLRLWEEEQGDTQQLPTLEQLLKFLNTRFRILESVGYSTISKPQLQQTKTYHVANTATCPACNGAHYVGTCKKFLEMELTKRRKCISTSGRCFNCLSNKHVANQCTNQKTCRECNGKHHTLLHLSKPKENDNVGSSGKRQNGGNLGTRQEQVKTAETTTVQQLTNFFIAERHDALLATALVQVIDRNGRPIQLRCLIDPGSQSSFVTEGSCKKLGIIGTPTKVQITGLNKSQTTLSNRQVNVQLTSCNSTQETINVNMLVIKKITDLLPTNPIAMQQWQHLEQLELADPTYWKPGAIDALLGSKVFAEILQGQIIKGPPEAPIALETCFGWILLGNGPKATTETVETFTTIVHPNDDISLQLRKFWELEEVNSEPMLTTEEKMCEESFSKTHIRMANGQYEVKLPFKDNILPCLGASRDQAYRRFLTMVKKLEENEQLAKDYAKCLDEYLELGHMETIKDCENINHYYIPHHAVFKDSTTTKLRVVFDASAKTTNGRSLNEQMLIGPTRQPKLFATLLKWRKYKIALTADIEKMYRMIAVCPEHRAYQRIIWRDPATKKVQDYHLKTVTFGTSSAPYLAIRTLLQLADDERERWPLAAKAAYEDFYVDDLLTGADTIKEANEIKIQCIEMLNEGKFNLRKWASNNLEVLADLPNEHRAIQGSFAFDNEETIKTLGIRWYPAKDYFAFVVKEGNQKLPISKRTILSEVASLYDPLGWISPIIIIAKILMQALWVSGCSWDAAVPIDILAQWKKFKENLYDISKIEIPRWLGSSKNIANIQIHGFCDASIRAYAAVVYMRVQQENGKIISTMVTSKTRVAPIKPITLPRLELSGAVLLAKLIKATINDMKLNNVRIRAWTDSMITLQWIKSHPTKWKTFVANRVVEIQENVDPTQWQHVPTAENPADLASRGVLALELKDSKLWWQGPFWLTKEEGEWPQQKSLVNQSPLEAKVVKTAVFMAQSSDLFEKYSSFVRLSRVIAMVMRFAFNCKNTINKRVGVLQLEEIKYAKTIIFKNLQQAVFPKEYATLSNGGQIDRKSQLITLTPFLDDQGVMRIRGRLHNAHIGYDRKHPIILPGEHAITNIIIDEIHADTLHGGVNLVLNTSRQCYWIINAKRMIARRINNCKTCIRFRKQVATQLMGNLPASRVNLTRPFEHVGIDYAGPIMLKTSSHRTARKYKGYFCVFVCMATRAMHLEMVSDLTSKAFIAALQRFVSRRGLCGHIYSDCGTNFKGAQVILDKELKAALKEAAPIIEQYCSVKGITWHFNPPGAPHFGGMWEAGVKAVKYHLKRVIGKTCLTYEEYSTFLCQIEACLNSRPLCAIENRTDEIEVLTPGHFLIGKPVNAIPEPGLLNEKPLLGQRWRHVQYLTHQFWKLWHKNYLHQLQQRPKWCTVQNNIKVGTVVLLKEDNIPPTYWPLGLIQKTLPGADGLVRVVEIKTENKLIQRPISKICPLIMEEANPLSQNNSKDVEE